jgi:nucleotide-binding universal stress UspA family protein
MKTSIKKSTRPRGPKLARILVPIDFSSHATRALRYAVPLARQVGGKITLLHVLEWPLVPAELGAIVTNDARLNGAARQRLDKLARATVPTGLLEKALVRVGRAHRDIADAARGLRMDLIVVSTHGRTGLKRALLGSTAERIVRHAPCPVLTLRRAAGRKSPGLKSAGLASRINRILVPVDFSARSKDAVRFAVGLARTMNARLALLHLTTPLPIRMSRFRAEMEQYDAETKLDARKKLDALAATVPKGIKVETLLRQELAHRGILDSAREWHSDLIVMPTRGLTGAKYIVLGCTAEAVVRHAPCPVLTLPGNSGK